ncbi:MAG TPA: amino acid adenylation domain-containing protein, partial [Thermoanaerobaculia bacterium]
MPGLEAVHIEGSTRTGGARFDLTLDLEETPLGLAGSLEYATDLFDATTISRWAGQWATLLSEAVAEPARAVPDLPLLGAAERQQLVLEWNDTKRGRKAEALGAELLFSTAERIHELFERQAALRPLAVAVAGQGQTLSYAELEIRANRLAHHLRRLGVGAETRVGLCVERSPEMVVALLGILKSGGAYVPLDPSHPAERLALVLGDIDLAVLVTEERWLERLRVNGRAAGFHIVCVDRDRERIAIERGTSLDGPSNVGPESLAYVIYTSGSTGRPKGVCLPHGAVVSFLAAMAERLKLGAAAVVPALTTLTFDIAGLEIYLPLALGGRVEVVDREEAADGHRLAARLACGMTAMQATPATWRLLLDAGWEGQPGLKALCGGELLPRTLASALQARGVELWNLYGPTETAVWSAAGAVPEPGESVAVDLGRPIAETRCHVVDRELALLPLGAAGELLIGGAGVARGYWGQPAWTAERFVPDPFLTEGEPGGRLYRTGDLVRWLPDGRLDYLGRMDHQVKVRGFRIELEEIENALCCHGGVTQAVAGLRPGPGDQTRLVAYVVAREGAAPAVSELSRHLRTLLPDYMIPSAWVFLDALPLTPNGKIDRRSLPEPEPAGPEGEGAAPRTPAEELLAGIWAEVLRVESVGGSDDFFALGGHSLLATKVVSRVRQAFGIELAVRELFEAPTVAGLAARLAGRASAAAQPITAAPHTTTPPLSFAQMRLWFLDQLQPGSWHYNLPHAVRVEGPLAPELLARCLGEVVRRHDVLRASFPPGDEGEARQRIAPPRPFVLPLIDLTALPAGPREGEQRRLEAAEARRP